MTEQELIQAINDLIKEAGFELRLAVRLPKGDLVDPGNFIEWPVVPILVNNGNSEKSLANQSDKGTAASARDRSITK